MGRLPDAAWAFALAYVLSALWAEGSPRTQRAWWSAGLALAAGWEVAEAFHIVPGTFDALDLLVSVVAYGAGIFAARRSASVHCAARSPIGQQHGGIR
jgi:hypothetical protein